MKYLQYLQYIQTQFIQYVHKTKSVSLYNN